MCERDYILNPSTSSCKNGKYLVSIIDDSKIMCDRIINTINTVPKNFNEEKVTCKIKKFHILLTFMLITIAWHIITIVTFSVT